MASIQSGTKPYRLAGTLAPGTVIGAAQTNSVVIATLGATGIRIRAKVSALATLKAALTLSDNVTPAITGNPVDVSLAVATENVMDVVVKGEAELTISILAGAGASTVTYVDVFPIFT
jgi:hypothetical protein